METYRRLKSQPDPICYYEGDQPRSADDAVTRTMSLEPGLGTLPDHDKIKEEIRHLFSNYHCEVYYGSRASSPCAVWRS